MICTQKTEDAVYCCMLLIVDSISISVSVLLCCIVAKMRLVKLMMMMR